MIQKTKNYSMFKFRADNRAEIQQSHVRKLVSSIQQKNMLEFRPILVNEEYEVLDGQNRLKAAEILGVDIYYDIQPILQPDDIIRLNVASPWKLIDYMNYYVKNHFQEYLKLDKFLKDNYLPLNIGLLVSMGSTKEAIDNFKMGKYQFQLDAYGIEMDLCWETISFVIKVHGKGAWMQTGKFWKSMLRLFKHPEFNAEKWRENMKIKVETFSQRATHTDYIKMVCAIYNYRNQRKINILKEEDTSE